ncbi:hypothetical protein ACIRON_14300 [Nocardioides sp. NPDC101246]|uniref:hypothetical protein n=1 Tax=Nocardioides sp. NPDC101246 TaxID=3364336 RepID=UPI00380131D8
MSETTQETAPEAAEESPDRTVEEARRLDLGSLRSSLGTHRLHAALAALVLVAAGLLAWQLLAASAEDPVRPVTSKDGYRAGTVPVAQDALEVAVEALPAALTYDYRTLDQSRAQATAQMTPAFAKEFAGTYDETVGKLAEDKQAVTKAVVRGGGVLSASETKVTTLVFVDQVLVASKQAADEAPMVVAQSRVVVELRRSGETWKVSDIRPF